MIQLQTFNIKQALDACSKSLGFSLSARYTLLLLTSKFDFLRECTGAPKVSTQVIQPLLII